MAGWIKLHRKILKSDMYEALTSKQRDVLITLLLMANHEKKKWEWGGSVFECEAGQFVTSLDSIRNRCARDVSVQNIKTALLKLETWQFLTNESTKTGRLITIVNWQTYQADDYKINKDSNQQLTDDQPTANRQLTPNKNDKNDKELKKKNNTGSSFEPLNFRPDFISEENWDDIIEHRKSVKATNTKRAYSSLVKQMKLAIEQGLTVEQCVDEMTNRSWTGFKVEWMKTTSTWRDMKATTVNQANILARDQMAKMLNDEADYEAGIQPGCKDVDFVRH